MDFETLRAELQGICKLKENLLAIPSLQQIENEPLDFLGKKSIKTWLSEACVLARAIASSRPKSKQQDIVDELTKALVPQIKVFKNALESLYATITKGNITGIYAAPGSLYGQNTQGQRIELAPAVGTAFSLWKSLENTLLILFMHLTTDLGWSKKLVETQEKAEKAAEEAVEQLNKVGQVAESVKEQEEEIQSALEEIRANLESANKHLKEIETALQKAKELQEEIEEWDQKLEQIQKQIQARENKLEALLEKMNAQSSRLSKLQEEAEELKGNVEKIIREAQTMLGFATGAGLSEAFKQSREHYQKQFESSTRNLYVSASIIVVASFLVIGGYLFDLSWLPGLGPLLQKLGGESAGQSTTFTGLLGRLVLILPLIWVFFLQVRTYNSAFYLQQAYRHRETITKALPSFRELTPNHQEGFLREVFNTAHRNPLPELRERVNLSPRTPKRKGDENENEIESEEET